MFLVFLPGQFLPSDNTQADKHPQRDIMTGNSYIQIHTVIIIKNKSLTIVKFVETQFKKKLDDLLNFLRKGRPETDN